MQHFLEVTLNFHQKMFLFVILESCIYVGLYVQCLKTKEAYIFALRVVCRTWPIYVNSYSKFYKYNLQLLSKYMHTKQSAPKNDHEIHFQKKSLQKLINFQPLFTYVTRFFFPLIFNLVCVHFFLQKVTLTTAIIIKIWICKMFRKIRYMYYYTTSP